MLMIWLIVISVCLIGALKVRRLWPDGALLVSGLSLFAVPAMIYAVAVGSAGLAARLLLGTWTAVAALFALIYGMRRLIERRIEP